ncbi:MAG: aldehyde dehydrogenase [Candidatus Thermoplasmatota archaeon]|nr:aldehyde dehydrogenase [Candidatus Thermoplasmatota archaeon]
MKDERIKEIVRKQREFFSTGTTKDVNFRIESLKKLKQAIVENEAAIFEALNKDLGTNHVEAYFTNIFAVLSEIKCMLKHVRKWSRPKTVRTPMSQFPGKSFLFPEPYGLALIIAPWNYPFNLLLSPLVGAIAAGNCCVLRPSQYAVHCSEVSRKIIEKTFPPEYIAVVEGGRDENQLLLDRGFDYVFCTGGAAMGRKIMETAGKHLSPVTLELGGKNPCIVDKECNIKASAERIAWGKFLNAGQTCLSADHVYVHKDVKEEFVSEVKNNIKKFYGEDPKKSPDFSRLINDKHVEMVKSLLSCGRIVEGGIVDEKERYISPTVLEEIKQDSKIMKEEVFGPIMPIITFENVDEVITGINSRPKPLALYVFSKNREFQNKILSSTSSGGVCINNLMVHASSELLPFGGVGESGMGKYHGKASFDTFTHYKGVMRKGFSMDSAAVMHPPYSKTEKILKWVKKFA